jgi:ribonucleoside-triphosphate reductase
MYQVIKRDNKVVDFNISKISDAIIKAFEAKNIDYNQDIIDLLALKVTADYSNKIKDEKVSVEEIQDSVESVLQRSGYEEVAKAYILYRKQREKIRYMKSAVLDYKELVDSYVKKIPLSPTLWADLF